MPTMYYQSQHKLQIDSTNISDGRKIGCLSFEYDMSRVFF